MTSRTARSRTVGLLFAALVAGTVLPLSGAIPVAQAAEPVPTITAVSPNSGGAAVINTGETHTVSIRGTDLAGVTAVHFGTTDGSIAQYYSYNGVLEVRAPAHALGTVDITVTSPAGTSTVTASDRYTYVAAPKQLTWSAPKTIDPHANLNAVSCSSLTFCMAVDASGYAIAFTHGRWQAPKRIDYGHGALIAVSCSSYTFCAATDDHGYAFTYHSGKWSFASHVYTSALVAVSCPTHLLCIAIGNGYEVGYTGDRWHRAGKLGPNYATSSVSCPTEQVCYVAGGDGGALVYKRSGAGNWEKIRDTGGLEGGTADIACPTATSCVSVYAGDDANGFFMADYLNGDFWSTSQYFNNFGPVPLGLSCPTISACLMGNTVSNYQVSGILFNNAGMLKTTPTGATTKRFFGYPDRMPLSCATATQCVMLGDTTASTGTR